MPKIGTLLSSLAVKAGIPADHKALIDILSKAELANAEISEEIGGALESGLISMDAAKNNPTLKAHYFAQALNGVDAETTRIMDEYGFDEDAKAELLAEKSSMKRVNALAQKIKALEERKAAATKKDQPDLQEKINALQKEKADAVKAMEQKIAELQATHENDITSMAKRNILAAKNYAASHLPADVNITTADILINRELETAGAKIVRKNGVLALVNATDPNMDYYDKSNNRPTVEQFIDGVLAQNKLLAVSNAQAAGNGQGAMPNGQQFNPAGNAADAPQGDNRNDALFDGLLKDFQTGSMPMSVSV